MEEIKEKYLPIGTVAMLKGGTKRVMITGYCAVAGSNKEKIWDYSGCMYPEGFLSSDKTCLFNHDQVEKIYHLGLIDEEEEKLNESLKKIVGLLEKNKKTTK